MSPVLKIRPDLCQLGGFWSKEREVFGKDCSFGEGEAPMGSFGGSRRLP